MSVGPSISCLLIGEFLVLLFLIPNTKWEGPQASHCYHVLNISAVYSTANYKYMHHYVEDLCA